MRHLIVAAHPDDEALGAGAYIHHATGIGDDVFVCLLSHWSPTRDDDLQAGITASHKILGVVGSRIGDFGCMRFKDADHHEIVRFIETCLKEFQPDHVITHHPADAHIDHGITAECVLEAVRLPQRQICNIAPIRQISFMEVPSSTDWNINPTVTPFSPNKFVQVQEEDLAAKVNAISVYAGVVRPAPHPRSKENLFALATVRGSQAGCRYAEAFQSVFSLEVDHG